MSSHRAYSEIIIAGNGVQLYWTALLCAKRMGAGQVLSLYEQVSEALPICCAGEWLDELHERIGVCHEDFLRHCKPRLSLGLEIPAAKDAFIAATPTGIAYRGHPFARLYGATGADTLGYYSEYNFARVLHASKPQRPPINLAEVLCEGLQMDYHIDGVLYRKFLMDYLRGSGPKVAMHSLAGLPVAAEELIDAVSARVAEPKNVLLLDLIWGAARKAATFHLLPHAHADFFALNRISMGVQGWIHSMSYGGTHRLDVVISGDYAESSCDSPATQQLCRITSEGLAHIKLGPGRDYCCVDVSRRILFRQLCDLYSYWPEPDSYAVLINKFNRTWRSWYDEAREFYNVLQSALQEDVALTSANLARVNLYSEVGSFPQIDRALIKPWEWENIVVAGLGVLPGNRGLPRDVSPQEVKNHMLAIKRSFGVYYKK